MNGFLGWEDPRQQAITAIAGGLLGGKGSFSSIAGQALLGGMDQYNRAGQYQAQRQEQQMRMDQYRAAQQDAVAKQLAQEKLLAQLRQQYPNDPTKALAAELAPGEWAKQQFSAPAKPIIEERFNPETGRPEKVILQDGQWVPFGGQQAAPAGETPQLAKLIQLRDALPPGDPTRGIYDAAIKKATTHAPAASANVYTGTLVPVEVGGKPAFAMPSKDGGVKIVDGIDPAGTADKAGKAKNRADAALKKADTVIASIDRALGTMGGGVTTTGLAGAVLGNIPGTSAYDLRATIDTVKANFGFQELQAMREASPTGGALGQVAVQELSMLQATVANLDANQSPEQLRASLTRARHHYSAWRDAVEQAHQEKGGEASAEPSQVLRYNPQTGMVE